MEKASRFTKNSGMPIVKDTSPPKSAGLSATPPPGVWGSLVAYVSSVSAGIAAVAALATVGVPVQSWITAF